VCVRVCLSICLSACLCVSACEGQAGCASVSVCVYGMVWYGMVNDGKCRFI